MALCTICGAVFSDLDMKNHVCKSEDVPQKGEIFRLNGTKELIK